MSEGEEEESFPGLFEALRLKYGAADVPVGPPETKVLASAQFVNDNAIDVAIDMYGTKTAAQFIWSSMQEKNYSAKTWSSYALHPKAGDPGTADFIFTMDLLNFCFWSDSPDAQFTVEYQGASWTGYWALVAALRRAIDEGIPITSSDFWQDENECTLDLLRNVFRSSTDQEIPLLQERLDVLRQAGKVLYEKFECSFLTCVEEANGSAAGLVNLVVDNFPCFRDEVQFHGTQIRLLKRAQILAADLWACFEGQGLGSFHDIEKITIFPDYRVPQMLHTLGCLSYSPPLDAHIRRKMPIESGHSWEIQLRGCSIWAVELILREIRSAHPDAKVNATLVDFFLYDSVKEREAAGMDQIPHHRTRTIWY